MSPRWPGVTLPLTPPRGLAPQHDRERQAFITNLAGPNLRIVGVFAEGTASTVPTSEQKALLARTRRLLSARPAGVDQSDLVRPWPAALREYATAPARKDVISSATVTSGASGSCSGARDTFPRWSGTTCR